MSSVYSAAIAILVGIAGCKAGDDLQTIESNYVTYEIPLFLEWEDDQGTLVASPPSGDEIVLRVSIHTILKDGVPVPGRGVEFISKKASELALPLHQTDRAVWYETTQPASDGSPGSIVQFWHVGFDAHGLVISCFVDGKKIESVEAQRVRESIPSIIESLNSRQTNGHRMETDS